MKNNKTAAFLLLAGACEATYLDVLTQ